MSIALVPGSVYYAGANRPWYVSQGMVTSYLEGKGFRNVQWHKRSEALPSDVNPRSDQPYSDDWDEWVTATYSGAVGSLSPPVDLPWLIVHLPSYQATAKPTTTVNPSWVAASIAASQAAAAAAAARQSAAQGVSSPAVAPAASQPDAPRVGNRAGAAVVAAGGLVLLFGVVRAILPRARRR